MDAAPAPLQWLPAQGHPEQLMILLHGVGSRGLGMAPMAQLLRRDYPQAVLMAPDGFEPFDGGGDGRQWFSVAGLSEDNRPARVAAMLPRLADWVRAAQQRSGVGPAATALVGFSQGAIVSLELAGLHDGLAGRVLAFAGRYAVLPTQAPRQTTLHFFHGADDAVIPAAHARAALERLGALQGDATLDIAEGIGHTLDPVLARCALERLRTHIPHRTWAAAMGAVPGLAERQRVDDDEG
ncbi:esterase [Ideonella sp. A 288]|uniref:esterase n=1 Tax=Ideonella sp. A 288 TaxID=1962181 RepID=UPI000B4A62D9|nr:esterase [Ideonella sp. A 288]